MRAARSSWLSSVEDIIFEHERLGVSAIAFSGDTRPFVLRNPAGRSI